MWQRHWLVLCDLTCTRCLRKVDTRHIVQLGLIEELALAAWYCDFEQPGKDIDWCCVIWPIQGVSEKLIPGIVVQLGLIEELALAAWSCDLNQSDKDIDWCCVIWPVQGVSEKLIPGIVVQLGLIEELVLAAWSCNFKKSDKRHWLVLCDLSCTGCGCVLNAILIRNFKMQINNPFRDTNFFFHQKWLWTFENATLFAKSVASPSPKCYRVIYTNVRKSPRELYTEYEATETENESQSDTICHFNKL